MKISLEFSKYAQKYNSHNIIQDKVAKKLLETISNQPQSILDLGCGSGAICKQINWKYEKFLGVDFAPGMLEIHPKGDNISCIYGNFNDDSLFDTLLTYEFDYIISASALQWAEDIENIFQNITHFDTDFSFAIFTSGTFKTLNETASIEPLLRSAKEIEKLSEKYFNAKFEIMNYQLEFDSTREIFKYIKRSGVSGSRNVLSYKETKNLMNNYPLNYLEFEIVFITSR